MKLFKSRQYSEVQKHPRLSVDGRVFIHDEGHLFIAPLNNLSVGGLFINRLVTLPEGSVVRITIKSSQFAEPIQAKGKIIRIETESRTGSAVEFNWISAESKNMIESCLKGNPNEQLEQVA